MSLTLSDLSNQLTICYDHLNDLINKSSEEGRSFCLWELRYLALYRFYIIHKFYSFGAVDKFRCQQRFVNGHLLPLQTTTF